PSLSKKPRIRCSSLDVGPEMSNVTVIGIIGPFDSEFAGAKKVNLNFNALAWPSRAQQASIKLDKCRERLPLRLLPFFQEAVEQPGKPFIIGCGRRAYIFVATFKCLKTNLHCWMGLLESLSSQIISYWR